jgi:hypothetical protein
MPKRKPVVTNRETKIFIMEIVERQSGDCNCGVEGRAEGNNSELCSGASGGVC